MVSRPPGRRRRVGSAEAAPGAAAPAEADRRPRSRATPTAETPVAPTAETPTDPGRGVAAGGDGRVAPPPTEPPAAGPPSTSPPPRIRGQRLRLHRPDAGPTVPKAAGTSPPPAASATGEGTAVATVEPEPWRPSPPLPSAQPEHRRSPPSWRSPRSRPIPPVPCSSRGPRQRPRTCASISTGRSSARQRPRPRGRGSLRSSASCRPAPMRFAPTRSRAVRATSLPAPKFPSSGRSRSPSSSRWPRREAGGRLGLRRHGQPADDHHQAARQSLAHLAADVRSRRPLVDDLPGQQGPDPQSALDLPRAGVRHARGQYRMAGGGARQLTAALRRRQVVAWPAELKGRSR